MCSKRLKPFVGELVRVMRQHGELGINAWVEAELCKMSPATIDRLLRPWRRLGGRRGLSTTRPGSLLKSSIPIRTFADWTEDRPGFLEVDLVPHCGESPEGFYLTTLCAVDVASGWSECLGVWGKGQERVGSAVHRVRQRCIVHRMWNVLARLPKKRQAEVKRALHRIFYAACLEDAQAEAERFLARYGREFPTATEVLLKHLGECLTFYHFPQHHSTSSWKNIRSTNALERAFNEVRRRTNVIGRFPTETAALVVVFGILEEERLKWRGVKMKAADISWIRPPFSAQEST